MSNAQLNQQVIDTVMVKIGEFLTALSAKVEANLDGKINQGSTKLGTEFAEKFSLPEPLGISLASMYVNNHPELTSKKGPNGGIVRTADLAAAAGEKASTKTTRIKKQIEVVLPDIDDDADMSDEE